MKILQNTTIGIVGLVLTLSLGLTVAPKTQAASLSAQLTITDTCTTKVSMSGVGSTTVSVPLGEDTNITVSNNDSVVPQIVSGPNIDTVLEPGSRTAAPGSYIKTFNLGPITTGVVLTFTPVPTDGDPAIGSSCPASADPVAGQVLVLITAVKRPITPSLPKTSVATAAPTTTPQPEPVKLETVTLAGKKIDSSKTITLKHAQALKLAGHVVANGVVNLTIHSTPKTATTTADSNGDWAYEVKGLATGEHYIEATVTDPATKQTSSSTRLLDFKIAAAVAPKPVPVKATNSTSKILVGVILAAVLLGVATWLLVRKVKQRKASQTKEQPTDKQTLDD